MASDTPDYDQIVRTVRLYVDGWNEYDVSKLKEAFHENAWIFFTEADGTLFKDLISNCFEWAAPGPNRIGCRVISVQQAGDVAGVLLGFDKLDDPADSWVDFHSLLKLDGVWKIMNKTATHSSRAAWAAPDAS